MDTGEITNLSDRGFGYIRIDSTGAEVFFHARTVEDAAFDDLKPGDSVVVGGFENTYRGLRCKSVTPQAIQNKT